MAFDVVPSLLALGSLFIIACGESAPPLASVAKAPTALATTPFSYAGDYGPEHWGDLDPKFATCKTGLQQSPLDLPVVVPSDPHVTISRPAYGPTPLVLRNNGHTIEIKNTASGSVMMNGVMLIEKRAGDERIFDRAGDAQATMTLRAFEHVHIERAAEQNRPRDARRRRVRASLLSKTDQGRFHRPAPRRERRTRPHEVDRLQDVAEVVSRGRHDEPIPSLRSPHVHQHVPAAWRP